jgi:hypothetical protein
VIGDFTASVVLSTAALSMPDDVLYHILKQVKPYVQVFFSQQDVPEEDVSFPYLLIEKSAIRTTGIEYGSVSVTYMREKYVSKECAVILTYVGPDAVKNLSEYVEARDNFSNIMGKLNVSLVLQDNVVDVAALLNMTTEPRAQVEGTIRYVDTIVENIGNIGTVKVEAEVFDIDGDKVYDEEIEITI